MKALLARAGTAAMAAIGIAIDTARLHAIAVGTAPGIAIAPAMGIVIVLGMQATAHRLPIVRARAIPSAIPECGRRLPHPPIQVRRATAPPKRCAPSRRRIASRVSERSLARVVSAVSAADDAVGDVAAAAAVVVARARWLRAARTARGP